MCCRDFNDLLCVDEGFINGRCRWIVRSSPHRFLTVRWLGWSPHRTPHSRVDDKARDNANVGEGWGEFTGWIFFYFFFFVAKVQLSNWQSRLGYMQVLFNFGDFCLYGWDLYFGKQIDSNFNLEKIGFWMCKVEWIGRLRLRLRYGPSGPRVLNFDSFAWLGAQSSETLLWLRQWPNWSPEFSK